MKCKYLNLFGNNPRKMAMKFIDNDSHTIYLGDFFQHITNYPTIYKNDTFFYLVCFGKFKDEDCPDDQGIGFYTAFLRYHSETDEWFIDGVSGICPLDDFSSEIHNIISKDTVKSIKKNKEKILKMIHDYNIKNIIMEKL